MKPFQLTVKLLQEKDTKKTKKIRKRQKERETT